MDPGEGLPDDFGVTAAHYAAAMGEGEDSLAAALAEGRLLLADVEPGGFPVPPAIALDYAADPAAWDAAYAPNMPLCAFGPLPATYMGAGDHRWLRQLPPLEVAQLQVDVGKLLGGVHHTRLGQYPTEGLILKEGWFSDELVAGRLADYQRALADVEATIEERDRHRPRYDYLLPSQIPQSINV